MKIRAKNKVIFFCFFLVFTLFAGQILGAQEREIVRLSNISGENFSITMHNERMPYTSEELRRGNISLEISGIVNTGTATSIDITLLPSGTTIRMAENTSLIYNGFDAHGNFEDYSLLYGRIRVNAENRTRAIVIRGGRAAARFVNGNFGIDHMLEADEWSFTTQPQLRLHAFQGNAEFYLGASGNQDVFESAQRQSVESGESISIAGKMPLESETVVSWDQQMPRSAAASGGGTQPRVIYSFLSPSRSEGSYRGKNMTLGIGLFLTVASTAALIISHPQFEIIKNNDLAQNINYASYIPLGMGLATMIGGIMYNPASQ